MGTAASVLGTVAVSLGHGGSFWVLWTQLWARLEQVLVQVEAYGWLAESNSNSRKNNPRDVTPVGKTSNGEKRVK